MDEVKETSSYPLSVTDLDITQFKTRLLVFFRLNREEGETDRRTDTEGRREEEEYYWLWVS